MTFAHSWMLYLLWVLPLLGAGLLIENRRKARAMNRFADPLLLSRLTGKVSKRRRYLKGALLLSAMGAMIVALAGPRWGSHFQELIRKNVDIVAVVDVSPSMLVEDVKPNRIEQAKRELWDFLRLAEGARVGLIAFSGVPFILCPLTTDHGSLATFLEALGVDLIPVLGTDLGAALELGLSAFDFKYESDRFLLVLSDGEDNEKKADEAARKAAKAGVKILTLGLGSPSGGPVPEGIVKRGFKKDKEGRVVLSKLDEEGLRHIAQLTGGRYVRSVVGDEDMKALSAEGMGEMKEGYDAPEGRIEVPLERFWVFAILAVLLLSLEYLLDERNGKPDLKRYDEAIG